MTKDWDLVQDEIKELSFSQKKTLEEVKDMMERKYRFRASTRAYRMKLKEWGLMRHRPHRSAGVRRDQRRRCRSTLAVDEPGREQSTDPAEAVEATDKNASPGKHTVEPSEWQIGAALPSLGADEVSDIVKLTSMDSQDLSLSAQMWLTDPTQPSDILLKMVETILDSDLERLRELVTSNVDHINEAIGSLLFEPNSPLISHPALSQMVILQHPGQTLFDIACAMPCEPIVWLLLAYGARGSKHPLGSDLALHNAIKNGRVHTVQALLQSGRSAVNGLADSKWTPLRQAVFWMYPEIVRILLRRGANVEDVDPPLAQPHVSSPLQLCLARRVNNYSNLSYRARCHDILKQLLNAGANIHNIPEDPTTHSALDAFLQPWKTRPYWAFAISEEELECFSLLVSKGANLQLPFQGAPCRSPSRDTFVHQALWHSTPTLARSVVDSFVPSPSDNGAVLFHEIIGSCPDAKRHAIETLRDIQVLLAKGVSPNRTDNDLVSPLRKCITDCPAVDLAARLQVLLDSGADPEAPDPDGVQPYILAAETLDEPLLSEVMPALVAKIRGRYFRGLNSAAIQGAQDFFPISSTQTHENVVSCSQLNGNFVRLLRDTVPKHVQCAIHKAYVTVVGNFFFDTMARQAKTRLLDAQERDEVIQIATTRQSGGISNKHFDLDFVVALLHMRSTPPDTVPEPASHKHVAPNQSIVSVDESSPASSVTVAPTASTRAPFQFNPNSSISTPITSDSQSPSSPSSPCSTTDFFIPSTTRIRWLDPCAKPTSDDMRKALDAVVNSTCEICNDKKMLTRREVERHQVEHAHSATCTDGHCARRFCAARRGPKTAKALCAGV